MPEIGVIGGSGVYEMSALENVGEVELETPFGAPSDAYVLGELDGREVAFLARHGRDHAMDPSHLPYRANIHGFKQLGVRKIISASAVGSLREGIDPLHMVIPDQFFDRTRGRISSYFGDGLVAHVSFADPLCGHLGDELATAAGTEGVTFHRGGTYVCMEGPQFSTRAESHTYRKTVEGATVIGMTNLQEAKLAREAEICYATLALVTDYDCWHETEEAVHTQGVLEILAQNADAARTVIRRCIAALDLSDRCGCEDALANAILTPASSIRAEARQRLELLVGHYLS